MIGRFTQEDTYRGDGLNLYEYVHNNPVKYVDPSGNESINKSNAYGENRQLALPEPEERLMLPEGVGKATDIVPKMFRSQVENVFDGTIEKVTCNKDVYRHWGDGSAESGSPWYST